MAVSTALLALLALLVVVAVLVRGRKLEREFDASCTCCSDRKGARDAG